jgi:hypothetical protein
MLRFLALLLLSTVAAAATPPDDPVHRFVAAFNAGAPALQAFYEAELHPALKTTKPIAQRMANYPKSRSTLGDLKVVSLTERPGGWRAQLEGKDAIRLDGEFEVKDGKLTDLKLQMYACHGGGHGCGPQSKPVERGGPTQ